MDAGRVSRLAGWLALAALAGVLGWQGWMYWQRRQPVAVMQAGRPTDDGLDVGNGSDIITVDAPTATDPNAGATPMAQRVAVLGVLNKRNGRSQDVTLKPGQATRLGDVIVRLRACEMTAPWEQEQLTGALAQVDVKQFDNSWRRAFSGWLFKERPALNVVINPVYDVWVKSCTMSFPDTGPDTESVADRPAPRASSAENAPADPVEPPSAAPSPSAVVNSN